MRGLFPFGWISRSCRYMCVSMAESRGALIVLEGADRSGKSTQARRLVETLTNRGHRAEGLRFPERTTEIGKLISSYLEKKNNIEDHTVHLLFSANRWEQVPVMLEKLRSGVTLIVDRYAFSGVAFTSSKDNFCMKWCKQPDVGLPKPDLVLFLKVSPEVAAARGGFGNERYETSGFQMKVQKRYSELMEDETINWKVVDASQSMEDVHKEIAELSEKVIQEAKTKPIGKLWEEN
ncbi:thymidylate kinase [Spea bombifrons]|uniref:thymidylate kinase n=1 Tax=Spea bombifrons TaxID=233779 RepID=UPI00234BCCE4|nr:thymidylate kinase [Spea bombifrons]